MSTDGSRFARRVFAACAALAAGASTTHAQKDNALPPVRQLGRRLALSTDTLGGVGAIRVLSGGRLLVNDVTSRRLVLFDSTLHHGVVVADSTPSTNKAYGTLTGGIIGYKGDSTFFVDPTSISLVLLDPNGKAVRVIAPPRADDVMSLLNISNANMSVAFDGRSGLIYRPNVLARMTGMSPGMTPPKAPASQPAPQPATSGIPPHDSGALVRTDLVTHAVDTLGFLNTAVSQAPQITRDADGNILVAATIYPMNMADEWAQVTDGSIAFVRASDYHIDWINADGTRSSTPKIAHEWKRLTDSLKAQVLDSTRRVADSLQTVVEKQLGPTRARLPAGMTLKIVISAPQLSDIPDYPPPFSAGAVKADCDDNLWIREGVSLSTTAPQTWDVVNRKGQLIDRVETPLSLTLIGFGPGVAYLSSREGAGVLLVTYKIR